MGGSVGGVGTVTIVCCAIFAALTGSGPATVTAIGCIMLPAMLNAGYSRGETGGMLAAAGALGPIIPPSICMIVYGSTMSVSVPELFLAAVDKETGKIAGTLNGLATNETKFRDAFFDEISLYDPKGENVMLLGLSVLPEYRGQGIARALMEEYSRREQKNGRKQLILTCLQDKVEMYKKMNFRDEGISASTWGGEEWHDMTRKLND